MRGYITKDILEYLYGLKISLLVTKTNDKIYIFNPGYYTILDIDSLWELLTSGVYFNIWIKGQKDTAYWKIPNNGKGNRNNRNNDLGRI